ncbi:MAG: hypothetical protein RL011_1176 [Pseudomonadota bacterium]
MRSLGYILAIMLGAFALGCKGGVKASVANNEPAQSGGNKKCLPEGPYGPDCPPPALKVTDISKVIAKPGELLTIKGENFRSSIRVNAERGAREIAAEFTLDSANQLTLKVPAANSAGLVAFNLVQDDVKQRITIFSDSGSSDFPVSNMSPDLVCGGLKYYDASGVLQTGTRNCGSGGSASGCNVDGQVGCLSTLDYPAIKIAALDPWNLRHGVTTAGVVGRLPVNCRNGVAKDAFSAELPRVASAVASGTVFTVTNHGFSNSDKVRLNYESPSASPHASNLNTSDLDVTVLSTDTFSLSNAGNVVAMPSDISATTISWVQRNQTNSYSTLDHALDYSSSVFPYTYPWSVGNICGGVETAKGDSNVWRDVTVGSMSTPSNCDDTPANCAFLDKISGLTWTKVQGTPKDWASAMLACSQLTNYNGTSGWRLPTQKELMAAAEHGAVTISGAGWIPTDADLWTATTVSPVPGTTTQYLSHQAWQISIDDGYSQLIDKSIASKFVCVK